MKVVATLLAMFITAPLWYWLMYQILVRVNATELMWFLFWVYVPAGVFVTVLAALAKSED